MIGSIGQANLLQGVQSAAARLFTGDTGVEEGQFRLATGSRTRQKTELLEDESNSPVPQVRALSVCQFASVLLADAICTRGGPVEQAEDIQKGALAGAAGANDGYVLTRFDGKRDVIESMQRGPADVVGPGYVTHVDQGR